MEFYSAIKNKDILSFAGKWMELENNADPKGHAWYVFTNKLILAKKKKKSTEYPRYSPQNSKSSTS
jgi:hypothetical protein